MFKSLIKISFCLIALLSLSGCGSNVVNPQLTITSTNKLNSQGNSYPAPVQVQIYSLRDYADFNKASFFEVYDTPRKTLGTDLIKKIDKIMVPSSTMTIPLKLTNEVQYLGLLVAFTKLRPQEDWRFVIPIEQLSNVKQVLLDDNKIVVELVDPAKPIVLAKSDVAQTPADANDKFSLEDMKQKGEKIQSAKDDFSADKLKEKYSNLDPSKSKPEK